MVDDVYVIKYVNTLSVAPHGDYDKIGLSCLHPLISKSLG